MAYYFNNNRAAIRHRIKMQKEWKIQQELLLKEMEPEVKKGCDFLEIFDENLKELLPVQIQSLKKAGNIKLIIEEEGAPNAWLKKENAVYQVHMTRNLDDIIFWTNVLYSTYPDMFGWNQIATAFLDCLWMLQMVGEVKPYYLNEVRGKKYDGGLSILAGAFFLAHEYGHIMIDINNEHTGDKLQEELLADRYACEIMKTSFSVSQSLEKEAYIYKSIMMGLCLFQVKDILEDNCIIDHPNYEARITNVQKQFPHFETYCETEKEMKTFFDTIITTVESGEYEQHQIKILAEKDKRWTEIMNQLDKSSRSRVPDYISMYENTYSIYKDLEYFTMIPEIQKLKKQGDIYAQQLKELGEFGNQKTFETTRSKLKLIVGYLSHLPKEWQHFLDIS